MKKIVFISYLPLTKKTEKDYYLDSLIIRNAEVEFWDLSSFYFSEIKLLDTIDPEYVKKFSVLTAVESQLIKADIEKTVFVVLPSLDGSVIDLFMLLTKYKCELLHITRGMLPLHFKTHQRIMKALKSISFSWLKKRLSYSKAVSLKKKGIIKKYDAVFSAGQMGVFTLGAGADLELKTSTIININSFDYDLSLAERNNEPLIKGQRYCVFLDEYLPFHPDFKMSGIKTINPEKYYNSLNRFFDVIESLHNIKVIIAAHPKAENYVKVNPFNERSIYYYQTHLLVRDSEFVLAHMSTAVGYAVIYHKPIIFLFSNDIKKISRNHCFPIIKHFAKTLDSVIVNIDNYVSNQNLQIPGINNIVFDDYKYKYLTSIESEGKRSADIFYDYVSKLQSC